MQARAGVRLDGSRGLTLFALALDFQSQPAAARDLSSYALDDAFSNQPVAYR